MAASVKQESPGFSLASAVGSVKRVLIVHGYLLTGTGSNLFVNNLCRSLVKRGHSVTLVCQEPSPDRFEFISRAYQFCPDNHSLTCLFTRSTRHAGDCDFYRPDIGGLLPVYVYDHYDGYAVKEYPTLSQSEIEEYVARNTRALDYLLSCSPYDLIISNHTIMQPVYVARARAEYSGPLHFMVMHGSCLNFSIRKSPALRKYALEGINDAHRIVFGSSHSKSEFLEFFSDLPGLEAKTAIIPAAVDVSEFRPLESSQADRYGSFLAKLASRRAPPDGQYDEKRLFSINPQDDPIVLYYGKYLWTKGLQFLVAAMPFVTQRYPHAKLILVGYGSLHSYVRALVGALKTGDRRAFAAMLTRPSEYIAGLSGEESRHLERLSAGLMSLLGDEARAAGYFSAGQMTARNTFLTGPMDHNELSDLIPCADLTVAPSVFPESFGMVAVEALASGVIPIQTNHSGFRDVIRVYEKEFKELLTAAGTKPLDLNENLVPAMAANILGLLCRIQGMSPEERADVRSRAHALADRHYSWDSMATRYLEEASRLAGRQSPPMPPASGRARSTRVTS